MLRLGKHVGVDVPVLGICYGMQLWPAAQAEASSVQIAAVWLRGNKTNPTGSSRTSMRPRMSG